MSFKRLDHNDNGLNAHINRFNYDLTKLEDSAYSPILLDVTHESINKIIQFKKTGRIFYSSHMSNYSKPSIKELNFDLKGSGFSSIMTMITGRTQDKRLKAVESVDQNEGFASRMFK